jgi:hypothetical protein
LSPDVLAKAAASELTGQRNRNWALTDFELGLRGTPDETCIYESRGSSGFIGPRNTDRAFRLTQVNGLGSYRRLRARRQNYIAQAESNIGRVANELDPCFSKAKAAIDQRSGVPGWTSCDLRRTARSL